MRKILSFGIAAALTAVAVTAWATVVTRSPKHPETATVGIDVFMLTTKSTNLQVQQYDAF
jgi:hypothetical protein